MQLQTIYVMQSHLYFNLCTIMSFTNLIRFLDPMSNEYFADIDHTSPDSLIGTTIPALEGDLYNLRASTRVRAGPSGVLLHYYTSLALVALKTAGLDGVLINFLRLRAWIQSTTRETKLPCSFTSLPSPTDRLHSPRKSCVAKVTSALYG